MDDLQAHWMFAAIDGQVKAAAGEVQALEDLRAGRVRMVEIPVSKESKLLFSFGHKCMMRRSLSNVLS